ncbi:MAG: hypothetical protein ACAI34_00885 [Verrucomicrobium sp.]|nr:hypothetical protein [Verrucomicrobium sp.]
MDITSPRILKLKGLLFLILGFLSGGLLLAPSFEWRRVLLFGIAIWAFCRAYYFCFYVLHHYADPSFRYAGLGSIVRYLVTKKKK